MISSHAREIMLDNVMYAENNFCEELIRILRNKIQSTGYLRMNAGLNIN